MTEITPFPGYNPHRPSRGGSESNLGGGGRIVNSLLLPKVPLRDFGCDGHGNGGDNPLNIPLMPQGVTSKHSTAHHSHGRRIQNREEGTVRGRRQRYDPPVGRKTINMSSARDTEATRGKFTTRALF